MQLYTKILIGMVVGLVLGLLFGPNGFLLPKDGVRLGPGAVVVEAPGATDPMPTAMGVELMRVVEITDGDPPWLKVQWEMTGPQLLRLRKARVPGADALRPGAVQTGWVRQGPAVSAYAPWGARLVSWTEWVGDVFLRLIKMVVVPLVFLSLMVGVASLGDFRKLGRLGLRTLLYFTATTTVALLIALGLANLVKPGKFMAAEDRQALLDSYEAGASKTLDTAASAPEVMDQIVGIIPTNPLGSLAGGEMLQVIFFALMFGVALTLLDTDRAKKVVDVADVANDAMIMLVHIAMMVAPYGVAALLFKVAGTTGLSVLAALGVYSVVVLGGLLLQVAITYGSVVTFGARLPFLGFLGAIRSAIMVAFSTSSSSATLPVTKEAAEQNLNVSSQVTSFVLPLGATVNMDGTALYQGVAAVFIAQIYNIDLSVADQATIVLTATLASVGAAGVPGAGMVTLALVLTAIGVPTEGLALILGVDRLLDMFRTSTNVVGDATAAALMGRLEGNRLRILTSEEDEVTPNRGFEGRLAGGTHAVPTEHDSHIDEPSEDDLPERKRPDVTPE